MRVPVIVAASVVVLAVGAAAMFWLRSSPTPTPAPAPSAPRVETPVAPAPSASTTSAPVVSAPSAPRAPKPAPVAPVAAPTVAAEAAPTTGTLTIEADVPDAIVLIDRIGVGPAPVTVPNLAPGPHRVNVSATGYDGYGETIDVVPGPRTISVKFKEIKLDVKIDAIHKHAMGSCKGVLSATPTEFKFVADDGKDSFSVPLADIDTFVVDYLAKNLRLKTKQGRTFNFSNQASDAEPLFIFHHDIDKVRKRLSGGG